MSLGSSRWKVVYFVASFSFADDVVSSVSALPPLSWTNRFNVKHCNWLPCAHSACKRNIISIILTFSPVMYSF